MINSITLVSRIDGAATFGKSRKVRALKAGAGRESVFWPAFEHEIGDPVEDAIEVPPTYRLTLVDYLNNMQQMLVKLG